MIARANGEFVESVGNEPPTLVDHVLRDRPEAVDRWHLAFWEGEREVVGTCELDSRTVDQRVRVNRVLLQVGQPAKAATTARFMSSVP